jgi:GNAT superfamily N-acetyltransferase
LGVDEVSSYRFCRTDDIALLVDALNRCWAPYFPDEALMTPAAFKRSIRDLQVWCSSCMVAFSGGDAIGVLIGAKRPFGTLVHKIAVHPDHRRQGHGHHLLESLGSKLAILGPPRIIAEVPESLAPARELFRSSGYVQESILTDYVLHCEEHDVRPVGGPCPEPLDFTQGSLGDVEWEPAAHRAARRRGFVIPITVDDLAANGLLEDAGPQTCWERSAETLRARKDDLEGLAVANDEGIEAYVLYAKRDDAAAVLMSLRSLVEDGGALLKDLLSRLTAQGIEAFMFPKVHPSEISTELLEALGFRPTGSRLLCAARARSG